MNLSLEGKNAVVCGSSQGIGLAVAQELALLGARCVLLARNAALLAPAVTTLSTSFHQQHSFAVADFSDTSGVKNAIHSIAADLPVHILVNNTGGPAAGSIAEVKEEEFVNAFHQHLVNNHNLAQAVLPAMKKEAFGRIINIISTSVKIPLPNLGVSNTIRAAVASWAKTMANEPGRYNITVNNILPGFTETRRLKSLIALNAGQRGETEEKIAMEMKEKIPLKRFGSAAEVAAVAAFLASPAASFVNGASIPVDGGSTGAIRNRVMSGQ